MRIMLGRHTLETNAVASKTLHSLLEEGLAGGRHTRDIVLLPLNGSIDVLKDFFDGVGDFSTNTVARNECDLDREASEERISKIGENIQCKRRRILWVAAGRVSGVFCKQGSEELTLCVTFGKLADSVVASRCKFFVSKLTCAQEI